MALFVCNDRLATACRVADVIEEAIKQNPELVLALATGSTSGRAYRELASRYCRRIDLTFRFVTTFNTDEFLGIPPEDPRSTRYFMNEHLFSQIDIKRENTYIPRGDCLDPQAECNAVESLVSARGGIDLAVLGLGHNGHVGFNEPGSGVRTQTRTVEFTPSTLAGLSDGHRFRNLGETPTGAITMGMGTLLKARHIVLIATGIGKAQAVTRVFSRRPGPATPASLLLSHPRCDVIVDSDAASAIKRDDIVQHHV
ncbi:MAG: glucosamine-6-phosphate deaminase [Planctomycetota bacterium]